MIWLVVYGMCDFLGNTYMPYQSIDYYAVKYFLNYANVYKVLKYRLF
jgi:hypothetical protein